MIGQNLNAENSLLSKTSLEYNDADCFCQLCHEIISFYPELAKRSQYLIRFIAIEISLLAPMSFFMTLLHNVSYKNEIFVLKSLEPCTNSR
jgi:hypothetical protein